MSSISKAPCPKNMTSESPEESGWTTYFDDFFNNQNIDGHNCSIMSNFSGVDSSSSSLVSDAASLAAAKLVDGTQAEELSMTKEVNRSSFKKRKKIKTTFVDDALEDTASSPVNSPKVHFSSSLLNFFLH